MQQPSNKPLVLIKTCRRFAERRAAQRVSWLSVLKWDRIFVMGNWDLATSRCVPFKVTEENVLQFDAPDHFGNMAPKVAQALGWAVKHGYGPVFICDDDTYVVPARLEKGKADFIESVGSYTGWRRGDGGYGYNWPYIQGAGYWLDRRAAEQVAASDAMRPGIPDDVAVGLALEGLATPTDDARYYPGPIPKPVLGNELISTHKCSPEVMKALHDSLYA